MADDSNSGLAAVQNEIKQLRADVARIAGSMRNVAINGAAEAAETVQASTDKLLSEAKQHAQSIGQEIEQRPLVFALAAFGTGILLGLLLSRRRGS
jgi:ElaB/YqjD/DUF883 family membrane-anchored ribosome-binding protein